MSISLEERRVFGASFVGRGSFELIKANDKFFIREEDGKKITDVPNEFSGRTFIDGISRCLDTMPKQEEFRIQKDKYFLVKNDRGGILIRTDDKQAAEHFIKGYQYCVENELFKRRLSPMRLPEEKEAYAAGHKDAAAYLKSGVSIGRVDERRQNPIDRAYNAGWNKAINEFSRGRESAD